MTQWQKQFGPIPQEEAFAYLLGALVSDAGKNTPHYTSTRLELNLSKNYDWSEEFGDAICYYLGNLSIHAEYKTSTNKHRWRSQNSPLLTWIKHICLGLTPQQLSTYTPINAPWILIAPRQIRIRILQGLNDGDGHVLTGYEQLGNACEINSKFLKELLKTFEIKSIINVRRVIIENRESILRAIELPFFLHAHGRQEKAIKLGKMARNKRRHLRSVVSKQVADDIIKLHEMGNSSGAIVEIIYDTHNICYSFGRIRKIIRDHQNMRIEFLSEYLEENRESTD